MRQVLPDAPLQDFKRSLDRRIVHDNRAGPNRGSFDERREKFRRFHRDRGAGQRLRLPFIQRGALTCRTRPRVRYRSGPQSGSGDHRESRTDPS